VNRKIYRPIFLPVTYGCKNLVSHVRREKYAEGDFENRKLRKTFLAKRGKVTG